MSRLPRLCATLSLFAVFVAVLFSPRAARADTTPGDPISCEQCPDCCLQNQKSHSFVSLTEGNVSEDYLVARATSAFGATLEFKLTYNSYNADNSRASIDAMVGFGWTHTFNDFLFAQGSDMFRMRGDGRVIRYAFQSGGTYHTSPGYFETLVKNLDGSFDITTKYKTRYHYQSVPNTPFLVHGPILRLISITDRNNNVTTLTYTAGDLTSIADTYNRSFHLAYNSRHHLVSIKDPNSQVTTITYSSSGCLITAITDPTGHPRHYTYNALFQVTSMVDRDGRKFIFQYKNNLPYAELDGSGGRLYALSNTSNWATDPTQAALNYMRVYVPSATSKTDGRGNAWQYAYDSNGHPVTKIAPDGSTTTYTYDPATLEVSSITDANLHTTSFQYDSQGNLLQRKDALGLITTYTYEPVYNQVTSMTDPNGRTTTYAYDGRGNRTSETDPLLGAKSWTYDSHGNMSTFTDQNNNPPTTYVYDVYGNLMETDQPLRDIAKYTYDIMGDRTSVTDANIHQTQYQYDPLYRLSVQTDSLLGTKQYDYDGEGDILNYTDENVHSTGYAYDLRRRQIRTTDALLKSATYTYDADDNRLTRTDRNVHTTRYTYDLQDRLIRTTDALGHLSSSTYDGVGNKLSETDANGHTTNYLYDAVNRRTRATDALNETTQWGYDLTGLSGHPECTGPTLGTDKVTKHTDANGKVIYYCYDGLDRLHIEIHKQGSTAYNITANDAVTFSSYDPNSNRLSSTEPDGNTTNYSYDALNRQVTVVNAAGDKTVTTYDPVGNVHNTTQPNSNVITNVYDALNRLVQQADSQALVQTISYDAVGNVITRRDGNNNGTNYTYDPDNRLIAMTDALGKSTGYGYDPVGNLVSTTDRNGAITSHTYDAIDRRTTMTDAQPALSRYRYDNVGNLTTITDANGHSTIFTYDAVNRRISERYPDPSHNTILYAYDAVGNRILRTDQDGQTTNYFFSDLYFLLRRTYPVSAADIFTYDLSGRVLSATRGGWAETFTYDGANRLLRSVQNGRTIVYSYNVPSRIRTVTYPGGRTIKEQMDFRNWLSKVNDGNVTPIAQYSYDSAERVLTRTYRNGTVASYGYNSDNWIFSLRHTKGPKLILGFNYAFDNEGNKANEQKLHDNTQSEGYGYDSVYRLIDYKVGTLTGSTITMVVTQTAYNLDALGNWTNKTTDMVTQTRAHSPSNEINKIDTTLISSDFNGNTKDDGVSLYSYDEENRLVQVAAKSTHVVLGRYQYDAFGRRVSKIDNFGTQTNFYYDGWRTIEEQSSAGVIQATYVFGNYVDEVLTMDRAGKIFYYHQNSLWSVYALTDNTGAGVEGYSYDAYGYQTVHLPGPDGMLWTADDTVLPGAKSAYGNPFLFTSQRYDSEASLFYYKNRNYSAGLGRFLTRDPAGYVAGAFLNLYEYVGDNPANLMDPYGYDWLSDAWNWFVCLFKDCGHPPPPKPPNNNWTWDWKWVINIQINNPTPPGTNKGGGDQSPGDQSPGDTQKGGQQGNGGQGQGQGGGQGQGQGGGGRGGGGQGQGGGGQGQGGGGQGQGGGGQGQGGGKGGNQGNGNASSSVCVCKYKGVDYTEGSREWQVDRCCVCHPCPNWDCPKDPAPAGQGPGGSGGNGQGGNQGSGGQGGGHGSGNNVSGRRESDDSGV